MKRTTVYILYAAILITALLIQRTLFGASNGLVVVWLAKFVAACIVSFCTYTVIVTAVFAMKRFPHSLKRVQRLRQDQEKLERELRKEIDKLKSDRSS